MTEEGADRSDAPLSDLIERLERRSDGSEQADERWEWADGAEPGSGGPDAGAASDGASGGDATDPVSPPSDAAGEPADPDVPAGGIGSRSAPVDAADPTADAPTADEGESDAPLSDLIERLERRSDDADDARPGDGPDDLDDVRAATEPAGGRDTAVTHGPRGDPVARGLFPAYPSKDATVAHAVITGVALASAFALFLAVGLSILPRRLWLLSLPLLAVGLFGLVPILAYQLGIWDPRQLG